MRPIGNWFSLPGWSRRRHRTTSIFIVSYTLLALRLRPAPFAVLSLSLLAMELSLDRTFRHAVIFRRFGGWNYVPLLQDCCADPCLRMI